MQIAMGACPTKAANWAPKPVAFAPPRLAAVPAIQVSRLFFEAGDSPGRVNAE
jgi:hypothetical protein